MPADVNIPNDLLFFGGVGGEPGRPGGIGEQTPYDRAVTDDCYPPSSSYATVRTLGYGSACSSPDSSPAHHAGLNCFGRSNTQFHVATGGTNDRSVSCVFGRD